MNSLCSLLEVVLYRKIVDGKLNINIISYDSFNASDHAKEQNKVFYSRFGEK